MAQYDYHTVCPFTINTQTIDIIYFISERQYMLESANYRSKIHLLTNCDFTQVRTATSETFFFLESRWCEFAIKHSEDRSISDSFWCSKRSHAQPARYKSKTTKSWQIIPQKLYIGLGNRKAGEKTDWDKHYIATSAKCIVGRKKRNDAFLFHPVETSKWRACHSFYDLHNLCLHIISLAHQILVYTLLYVCSYTSYSAETYDWVRE